MIPAFKAPISIPMPWGRVIRLSLALDVVPVFAPPWETGFQAAIEGFNAQWQAKVWARFHHDSLPDLQGRSARYIAAAPPRRGADHPAPLKSKEQNRHQPWG